MGCFIYISRLEKSPYADLFSPQVWHDVQQTFSRLCCGLMGLPRESPHYIWCASLTLANGILTRHVACARGRRQCQRSSR